MVEQGENAGIPRPPSHLSRGLKTYIDAEKPYIWVFNGKNNIGQVQQFSETGVQWIVNEAGQLVTILSFGPRGPPDNWARLIAATTPVPELNI